MHKSRRGANPSPAMHTGRIWQRLSRGQGETRRQGGSSLATRPWSPSSDAAGVHHPTTVLPAAEFVHQGDWRRTAERLAAITIETMIKLTASIEIAASPADVIDFIAEPANAPRWMKALDVAELLTAGPIGPGTRFREVQSAGGKPIESICEITELEPGRRYAWRNVDDGPAQYGGGFTAHPSARGTDLRYEGWATLSGRLADREKAWARQAQRESEAELEAIKAAIEAGS